MHEMSIASSLMEIVLDTAEKNEASKVTKVFVKIGRLAAIENSALLFAFDVIRDEYEITKGAELVIEDVPVTGKCHKCGHTDSYEGLFFACSACGAYEVELLTGEELSITEIEVD